MPSGITAIDLIKSSLRVTGCIATGETPTADEANDGLICLNDLMEVWSLQNLAVWGSVNVTFNTVNAQATYTIGPTGQWVTDRPVRINEAPYCTVGGVNFPIDMIGQADYDLIALLTQPGQIIEKMLYVNDNPSGRITLWPTPNAVVPITMNIDRVLAQVPTLATVLTFPPGYLLAFKHALAVLLAPDYGRQVAEEVRIVAVTSMASIKRANKQRRTASYDAALVGDGSATWQRGV